MSRNTPRSLIEVLPKVSCDDLVNVKSRSAVWKDYAEATNTGIHQVEMLESLDSVMRGKIAKYKM